MCFSCTAVIGTVRVEVKSGSSEKCLFPFFKSRAAPAENPAPFRASAVHILVRSVCLEVKVQVYLVDELYSRSKQSIPHNPSHLGFTFTSSPSVSVSLRHETEAEQVPGSRQISRYRGAEAQHWALQILLVSAQRPWQTRGHRWGLEENQPVNGGLRLVSPASVFTSADRQKS